MRNALALILISVTCILQSCSRVTAENTRSVINGEFKAIIISKEFNHSGSTVVQICVISASASKIDDAKQQCFFNGYDLGGLVVTWPSPRHIAVSYDSGRVTHFTNSAFVYPQGPVPTEFRISLADHLPDQ